MEYVIFALFGLLGMLLHIVVKIRPKIIKREKIEWRTHIINTIFSALIVGVIVGLKEDIEAFYPVTKFNMLITGYAADSIWRNFTKKALDKMGVKDDS